MHTYAFSKYNFISKGAFIVCCNAAVLPMYQLLIYRSSTQSTAPQVHFLAVPQCSSRHRDENMTTATYRNTAAVDYERSFTLHIHTAFPHFVGHVYFLKTVN